MIRSSIVVFALFAASLAHAELTVVQSIRTEDGSNVTGPITIRQKDGVTRIDAGSQMTTIHDAGTGDTITLAHDAKTAIRIPKGIVEQMQANVSGAHKPSGEAPTLVSTGKRERIGGFDCEEFSTEIAGTHTTIWFATDLPDSDRILKALSEVGRIAGNRSPWPTAWNQAMPGVPIRMTVPMSGVGTAIITVESISADPIDPDVFRIPAGYQTIDMPSPP